MRFIAILVLTATNAVFAGEPVVAPLFVEKPGAFETLVNPACSHCRDEAKRRAMELRASDRVLSWTRGYSDGGAIAHRFFLTPYRVISDSYGVFVYDPDAGYSRGFSPSFEFRFHGWRNGVMVMKHKDGTFYSCLSGVAFDGPNNGNRLTPIPTVVSDWGFWLEKYPNAVAYHMFDKYQPTDLPMKENADSVKSRSTLDQRLKAGSEVLGVRTEKAVRAYPVAAIERDGIISETLGGEALMILWEPKTRSASAYRPVATQPRKYKAPAPNASGVSKVDEGTPLAPGAAVVPPRTVALSLAPKDSAGRFQDAETHSLWDVAGRCVDGELNGWTLEWVDSTQVKWFAWAAEYPQTTIYSAPKQGSADNTNKKVNEVAGTAEFLRLLPKPFATLKAVDVNSRTVTLLLDGETETMTWPVEPDAEVKVGGWWGRLGQFQPGDRVWVWLKLDRKKKPASIVMLADEVSEYDMHGRLGKKTFEPKLSEEQLEAKQTGQKAWLRKCWIVDGLPGTLTFHHVFSGELELALDHESMRWGRSLNRGDEVLLAIDPPIKAVVKAVTPWRERTMIRLVVGELESSELKVGQRLTLKMTPLAEATASSVYPPDIDRPRTKAERVEWFLASTYCTCGINKDTCTGHFYTLASCNPNSCGMPNRQREQLGKMIDGGMTDRQIFDAMLKDQGPLLLRPHLMP